MQSRTFTVGTAAQLILGPGAYGALLQADPANTADIYIGGEGVTANTAETGGVRLSPGGALAVKVNAQEYLFVISSSAGQSLRALLGDQDEWISFAPAGSLVQGLGAAGTPVGGVVTAQPPGASLVVGQTTAATLNSLVAPAVAGKTNRLLGVVITGGGATTATLIKANVTDGISWTLYFDIAVPAGVTSAIVPIVAMLPRALPAALATAITLNVPSFGAGNTSASAVLLYDQV